MFVSAESERPTLTNREIIFEEYPAYVITIHQRHRRPAGQTTCDRNTALCTKVHRAVKIVEKCKPEGLFTLPTDDVMSWQNENTQLVCVGTGVKFNIWDVASAV